MRAQGEQYLQQAEIGEQRRLQQIQISEGQRTQQADAAGRSFMFNAQERRKDAQINFTRGQITGQTQRAQQAYDQGTAHDGCNRWFRHHRVGAARCRL